MRRSLASLALHTFGVLALASLPSIAAAPDARADDDGSELTRIDLGSLRAQPAAKSARSTWAPTDPMFEQAWSDDAPPEEAALFTFKEPPYAEHAIAPDAVYDLVRRLVPEAAGAGWAGKAVGDALEVWSTKEGGERAKAAVRYIEHSLAPRLSVRAVLSAGKGADGGPRLVAVGAARLVPRRWTTVWLRTHTKKFTAYYQMEIAQEVVSNHPVLASLPEGEELHLRWSPGEKTSLLEVFSGETSHRPPQEIDLSPIRNFPESNAPGVIQLPRTAVRRSMTAVVLDASKPGTAEWGWESADGSRTLKLLVDAAPAAPADMELTNGALGVVRSAAAAAELDDAMRESRLEASVERFQAGSSGGARAGASPEVIGQAFLLCEGPKAQIERLRTQIQADEKALAPATVEIRAVAAPAAVLREDVEGGRVAVGGVLDPGTASTYLRAPIHAAARAPVTSGIPALFTCGASVMGFAHTEVEVAQQAGGIYVSPRARFDGFIGRARVQANEGGVALRVSGSLSWMRPDGSTLDLAFRRPIGLSNAGAGQGGVDDPSVRRFPVPIEAHGSSAIETEVLLTAADVAEGRWAVLAVALRPGATADGSGEPLLLLASVRR